MTPWLKVRCDLHEDTAVISAALSLGVSENEVVGALVKFWSWANRETRDGNAPGVTKTWLDRYVGVTGFADALVKVGWLSAEGDGITVPKFDRHNGASAKARAQGQRRVETYRHNSNCASHGGKLSCNAPVTQSALTSALPELEIEEEIEEEIRTPLPPSGESSKPPRKNANSLKEVEGFTSFWGAYPRKVAKPRALRAFSRLAPDAAVLAMILAAIERQKKCGCLDRPGFIPHPATWLNDRRWEDEVPPSTPHANGKPSGGMEQALAIFAEAGIQ